MPKLISDQDVFDAALKVLAERGYAGATTKAIADAAGVNEATLFRKYGTKPELMIRALQAMAFRMEEGSFGYSGNLEGDLVRAFESYADMMRHHGHLFPVIMTEMARHPELREAVQAPAGVIQQMATLLLQYRDEGLLKTEEDPLQAVASFLGPLIIIGMLRGASPRIAPTPLDAAGHVRRYLRGRT